jgi:hypothetical protein
MFKILKNFYIISALRNSVNNCALRTMYFACFHSHLRYGVTLWGGDPEALRLFRLQKKVVRVICNVIRSTSCRELFKGLKILPLPCLYISEVVNQVKSNWKQTKLNKDVHFHYTRHNLDIHAQYCRTKLYKNNYENTGIKLFNKLPDSIKRLTKPREFRRQLFRFLLQHVFYSVDEYMSFK